MFVTKFRKIFFLLSGLLIALSIYGIVVYGFNYSIDFKGGTLTEVKYNSNAPTLNTINASITKLNIGGFSVRPSGENDFIIRTAELSAEDRARLLGAISLLPGATANNLVLNTPTVERQDTIGPIAGAERKSKAIKAIAVVVIMIVLFVTFAFRRVSKPVASWKYGLAGVIALFHDVIVVTGVFCVLGKFYGVEVNTPFVAALLTVFGYSIADTIVVLDRIRENLPKSHENFEDTVNTSINQTIRRSINTSMTVMLTLLAVVLLGGASIKYFALALLIGIFFGTYSSIFIASPLLVLFEKNKK